ncbi:Redox-regulatory protein [Armadillidium vulgare]|nr:Redox-regulatory protein [Armadillidium vulgare]
MPKWPWLITGALTSYIAYVNIPTSWMKKPDSTTLEWLSAAQLESLSDPPETVQAKTLYEKHGGLFMAIRRPGCILCRKEAQSLSNINANIGTKKIPLYGILHEKEGAEQFKEFFKGDLYYDPEKRFFGPGREKNVSYWVVTCNCVYLIGPGDTGILYEHKEMEFGDAHNETELMEVIAKMK